MKQHPYFPDHELRKGKLFIRGEHKFLKTGKPLRNFSDQTEVDQLIEDLPLIKNKGYDNLALNCYWHHFNPSGDGSIEVSLDPLKRLIASIRELGMFVSLSVETYGVGGGQIPAGFWERHPEAIARNNNGVEVRDTEYGYNSAVPSIFHDSYITSSRQFMKQLVEKLGAENFLYFETTVEPQYMGDQWIDYSNMAEQAYAQWRNSTENKETPDFPKSFPVDGSFCENPHWNSFRAQALANWINGDARAIRAGANDDRLWIAADYLDAEEHAAIRRCGNPIEYLSHLTEVDIIQVNWSWCNIRREPNTRAYKRVHQVMKDTKRDWAISEHMTINGADYSVSDMEGLLKNALLNGTCFGWEFVDIAADRDDPELPPNAVRPGNFKPAHFAVYDENWNPKPPMAVVENSWQKWRTLIREKCSIEPNPATD